MKKFFNILTFVVICVIAAALSWYLTPKPQGHDTDTDSFVIDGTSGVEIGGEYTLIDHNGKTVTQDSWQDKHQLIFFGFTHCPDVCPSKLSQITQTMELLTKDAREEVQPLFVSIDPERDTPDVMKEYVSLFDNSIIGLTGDQEQIDHIKEVYRVYVQKQPGPKEDPEFYMVDHSAFTYLMTPDGSLSQIFPFEMTPKKMAETIEFIVQSHNKAE